MARPADRGVRVNGAHDLRAELCGRLDSLIGAQHVVNLSWIHVVVPLRARSAATTGS
jgi:hypothetical protein